MFETNGTKGDKLVAIVSSGLLADLMSINQTISTYVTQKILNGGGLALLVQLLDINQTTRIGDLKIIQGTNFGCPYSGFYD